jgi:hypothetical protein
VQEAALNKEEIGFDSMIIGDNHNFPCEKKVVTNLEDESSPSFFYYCNTELDLNLWCVWVRDLEPAFGMEPEFGERISQFPRGIYCWDL